MAPKKYMYSNNGICCVKNTYTHELTRRFSECTYFEASDVSDKFRYGKVCKYFNKPHECKYIKDGEEI